MRIGRVACVTELRDIFSFNYFQIGKHAVSLTRDKFELSFDQFDLYERTVAQCSHHCVFFKPNQLQIWLTYFPIIKLARGRFQNSKQSNWIIAGKFQRRVNCCHKALSWYTSCRQSKNTKWIILKLLKLQFQSVSFSSMSQAKPDSLWFQFQWNQCQLLSLKYLSILSKWENRGQHIPVIYSQNFKIFEWNSFLIFSLQLIDIIPPLKQEAVDQKRHPRPSLRSTRFFHDFFAKYAPSRVWFSG